MTFTMGLTVALVLALAWANGANDIAKGVATLVGNGTAQARRAVWWGTLWTLAGGLAALAWGVTLLQSFGSGYLSPGMPVTPGFVAAIVLGAAAWVAFATRFGLPVSTTHALLGALVGATLVTAGVNGLRMAAVAHKALAPLLLSPLIAVALCALILLLARWVGRRIPAWRPGCCPESAWREDPFRCAPPGAVPATWLRRTWTALHWLSGGLTSFARGLNDVPKIAAFLVLAGSLSAQGGPGTASVWAVALVALAMGLGCLWGGFRVLEVLSHRVTPLDAGTGLAANLGTSMLVLAASPLGLPVSTTHVSTGALLGVRWTERARPQHGDALRAILFGWVITLPVAGVLAAAVAAVL